MHRILRLLLLSYGIAFAAPAWAQPLKVVATFTILADMTRQIGGDLVDVQSIVGPDTDVHTFSPTPEDARRIASAGLVVVNGHGFEGWIERLVSAAGAKSRTITAGAGVKPLGGGHSHAGHSHDHGKKTVDPHAWTSVPNARLYARNIGAGLAAALPAEASRLKAATEAYIARLDRLDADLRSMLAQVPESRRRAVTSHDAFGYFAREYKVTLLSPVGLSSGGEPSAADMAKLIRQIKSEKIQALFVENIGDRRVLERIAADTGARIGGRLYSDSLSPPGGPAETYEMLMRHNVRQLAAGFAGN
jgi:zinc/manganese transport system substrate-binding protein